MPRAARPTQVVVVAYDGCLGSEIFGMVDLLTFANRIALRQRNGRKDLFNVTVAGRSARDVATAGGQVIRAARWPASPDLLVVPGFALPSARHLDESLQQWRPEIARLASAAAKGIPVASVCIGAFLLGEAGLLDGRHATTSWLMAEELQRCYPRAIVEADRMIATDGQITTAAAFSAVHDLALQIIRTHAGDDLARHVARLTLVADNRTSQAPYVDPDLLEPEADTFARPVMRWLVEEIARPYDLTALARAFHVSTRTMLRRFKEDTGQSPLQFLQQARVDAAKRLLESPHHNPASAMEAVGYTDAASFRRLFNARVGMTPAAYRRHFRTGPSRVPSPR